MTLPHAMQPGMHRRLRVVVVDDESLARARLCRMLGNERDVEMLAECANGDAAIAALRALRPDVVFLDVRMPDRSGFCVLDALAPAQRPSVVFVTGYAHHALRAFDADAVDYLLKPYSAERLREALARVRRKRGLLADGERSDYPQRLAVPVGERIQLLAVDTIDCVIARSNYVELRAGSTQHYLLRETMAGMEARLDPSRFVRVHRSRIVRIDAVRDIEPIGSGQYLLRMVNGERVTTGASYRDRLRAAMGLHIAAG